MAEEELLIQQQRDLEAQSVREAILGKTVPLATSSSEQQKDRGPIILDFTAFLAMRSIANDDTRNESQTANL